MKKCILSLSIILCFVFIAEAQIKLDKIVKKTKKKVEQRTEKKIDKTIDKGLDKVENGIDNSTKTKEKNDKIKINIAESDEEPVIINEPQSDITTENKPELNWSKYDFIAGTEIIFEDNLLNEKNGEFPSKWDLIQGQFENAKFDGENVIYSIKCNMNGGGGITPMMKNCKEDYLPEDFTIEFDAYFESKSSYYQIYFADYKNQKTLDKSFKIGEKWIRINKNSIGGKNFETNFYPGFSNGKYDNTSKWRHVAISFNKRALKIYLDDARVANIPNLGYNPTGFSIGYQSTNGASKGYFKNTRIAKGAVPLYDKLLTDGKIITNGIRFDVNKSTIKAESMGVINDIVKIMNDHPKLNFSIEGHTDSDGDEATNLILSQNRAKAVMNKLIEMGIAGTRLKNSGFGETKPISDNNSNEGKARNRRVEFVNF